MSARSGGRATSWPSPTSRSADLDTCVSGDPIMSAIDLDALRATPLGKDPYDHIVVPGFIKKDYLAAINRDYPRVDQPGSVPVNIYPHGPAFESLLNDLRGPEIQKAFEEKFDIDLGRLPRMFTVRGMCRLTDGKIHPDSASKVITVLIYMNPPWEAGGGRLRLLRTPN